MTTDPITSVDAYIAAQPAAAQPVLAAVRSTILEAMPGAAETISYKIPTYRTPNGGLLYFAGWKKHFALYPLTAALQTAFADALAGYDVAKGTIRFGWDKPPPLALIARLAAFAASSSAAQGR
jgi:uncharacterized protein YdhG (YjbR/CyaY superfamily)